ncbi:MAG: hypothetical protein KatS3mg015_0050 [Fimbriimonadales bacterium]|nr:MAG: hypothetical protein KatS3mg015_0050 [Fimbriimonadales bacterium]
MRLRYLEENTVRLTLPAPDAVRATCEIEGKTFERVQAVRCFPLTIPEEYVALLDEDGNEIGILRHPENLDEESRRALQALLERRYFTPQIERIDKLVQEASLWRWEVMTAHGRVGFYIRGIRDSIHEVAPGRWHIYSVDGQRFEIRDLDALDPRSRSLFEGLF